MCFSSRARSMQNISFLISTVTSRETLFGCYGLPGSSEISDSAIESFGGARRVLQTYARCLAESLRKGDLKFGEEWPSKQAHRAIQMESTPLNWPAEWGLPVLRPGLGSKQPQPALIKVMHRTCPGKAPGILDVSVVETLEKWICHRKIDP